MIGPTPADIGESFHRALGITGVLPLCHLGNSGDAVFPAAQTLREPQVHQDAAANRDATIEASLPYVMAASRVAHYLKAIVRNNFGAFLERRDCERWLDHWLGKSVAQDEDTGTATLAPLRAARITVSEVPGAPGTYYWLVWMWPRLQPDDLSKPLKTVVRLDPPG